MIPSIWQQSIRNRENHHLIDHNPKVTRRHPERNIPRITHKDSYKRYRMRNISIHCLKNPILLIIFLIFFFRTRLSPTIELGSAWPPTAIQPFTPIQVPLLNTAILLVSGVTVTWAHHSLLENNATQATHGLFFTVVLGVYFTVLQTYGGPGVS